MSMFPRDDEAPPPNGRDIIGTLLTVAAIVGAMVVAMLVIGCDRAKQLDEPSDVDKARAVALVALLHDGDPTPSPRPPAPDAGICGNCRGTGVLGDGTIKRRCPVCGGDGRTDQELRSVLSTWTIDADALATIKPARRWQVVVVSSPGCQPCKAMADECARVLSPGWVVERIDDAGDSFVSYVPQGEADIIFDERTAIYEEFGIVGKDDRITVPHVLFFGDGECLAKRAGRMTAAELGHWIYAQVAKLPARYESYEAIPGGSVHAAEEIGAVLDQAEKFLGATGSVTIQRPAGEVATGQATITFPGQTVIVVRMVGGKLVATCTPPPRLKIAGVPLLKPALAGLTIGREAITLDLQRWPDVTIAVKEAR